MIEMFIEWVTLFCFRFPNLGIQCTKKKEVPTSLAEREQLRVDPFQSRWKITYPMSFKYHDGDQYTTLIQGFR